MASVALMIGLVVVSGVGLLVDCRTLLGKPLRFGVAFTLYSGVLADGDLPHVPEVVAQEPRQHGLPGVPSLPPAEDRDSGPDLVVRVC
ncbi:hypothetical protein [Streptosporangium sp. NPDC001681]|uniref:hypothetical protein n=1 Tax=Streptosporangium sp. NPDC001681 TaxID=3154395 RepID=UPI0033298A26